MNATHHKERIIAKPAPSLPSSEHLLELIEQSLDDDKAINVVSINLVGKSSIADAMVVASGANVRQAGAMAVHLRNKLKAAGIKGISIEGLENCDWVLIDGGDIIVHLFRPEVREFYNLEKLWAGALPETLDFTLAQN